MPSAPKPSSPGTPSNEGTPETAEAHGFPEPPNTADQTAALEALATMGPAPDREFAARVWEARDPYDTPRRMRAARALGKMDTPEALEVLLLLARGKNNDDRLVGLQGLAKRKEPAALTTILDAYQSGSPEIRVGALQAMAGQTDPETLAILIRDSQVVLIHDSQVVSALTIREAAARGLSSRREPEAFTALAGLMRVLDPNIREAIVRGALRNPAPEGLDVLLQLANDPSTQVQKSAFLALAERPEREAFERIMASQESPNSTVQRVVVSAVASRREPEAVEATRKLAAHPYSTVREGAAWGLTKRRDPSTTTLLIKLARDSEPRVACAALDGLATRLGEPSALEAVISHAQDWSATVSVKAIQILSTHPSDEAFQAIMRAASPRPPLKVLWGALAALGPRTEPEGLELLEHYGLPGNGPTQNLLREVLPDPQETRDKLSSCFAGLLNSDAETAGTKLVEAMDELLVAAVQDDQEVRRLVASSLGERPGEEGVKALLALCKDMAKEVRIAAVTAIAKKPGEAAYNGILEALDDDDYEVQEKAVAALGVRSEPEAFRKLLQLTKDISLDEAARETLGLMGVGVPQ